MMKLRQSKNNSIILSWKPTQPRTIVNKFVQLLRKRVTLAKWNLLCVCVFFIFSQIWSFVTNLIGWEHKMLVYIFRFFRLVLKTEGKKQVHVALPFSTTPNSIYITTYITCLVMCCNLLGNCACILSENTHLSLNIHVKPRWKSVGYNQLNFLLSEFPVTNYQMKSTFPTSVDLTEKAVCHKTLTRQCTWLHWGTGFMYHFLSYY